MKKLTQLMCDPAAVGYFKILQMLRLNLSDLLVICAIQAGLGFAIIAWLEMPWSILGYVLVLASAYTLKTIPAIQDEMRNQSS
jgi:hypothetical protein